ncbi:MAG TPA: HAMP domain-containing sensor histidine kinase [Pirellulales bacterium]|nr:HAMP domain-containing sensor histidine kinase [Pirellulales bacterium]
MPIRNKLLLGITLLLVIVVTLAASGFRGVYAYRGLVKSLRARADELPLATTLLQQVSDLRATAASARGEPWDTELSATPVGLSLIDGQFSLQFAQAQQTLRDYRARLLADEADERIGDTSKEVEVAAEIEASLDRIASLVSGSPWWIDEVKQGAIEAQLAQLQTLAAELPSHLHGRLAVLAGEVRTQYRSLIAMLGVTTVLAAIFLALFIRLFYRWVFQPLRVLVTGSRRVAAGDFNFRIKLASRDEIGELAESMNDMTSRFQAIRDDLDRQVQVRTKQVVRSEQLASVGFLAAGVAHEINNPLASIAMCAESLESRLAEFCSPNLEGQTFLSAAAGSKECLPHDSLDVMQQYLRMIQSEAFRCKGITEKLLDFSRIGEVRRHNADLRELVVGVIDMVRHLGKYQDRTIVLIGEEQTEPILASVNAQEIKQVVLNLITNALDSLDPGGTLQIDLAQSRDKAEIVFTDNGCGMSDEVLAHLFEPFFTRKRGGQGTGLGLSIVYRIVTDHGGQIDAQSDGPGRGSRFKVTLPLARTSKEASHRYQAA